MNNIFLRITGFLRFLHILNVDAPEIQEKHDKYNAIDDEHRTYTKFLSFLKGIIVTAAIILTIFGSIEGVYSFMEYQDKKDFVKTINRVAKSTYYHDNSPKVALELLDRAEELDNSNAEIKLTKVFIESMQIADNLLDIKRLYTSAELYEAQKALANCEFLIQNEDNRYLSDGYFAKSQIYLALKDYNRASRYIDLALKNSDNSLNTTYYNIRKATILIDNGNYKYARKILEQSIKKLKRNKDNKTKIFLLQAYNWLGIVDSKEKKFIQAKENFNKALIIDDRFSDALYNLAEANIMEINISTPKQTILENEKSILKLLKINPDNKYAYWLWGYMYGSIDEYETANGYFDRAIEIDSKYFDALLWKGVVLYEQKDYAKSLLYLNKALKLKPKSEKVRYRRGIVKSLLNKSAEAVDDFDYVLFYSNNSKLKYKTYLKKIKIILNDKSTKSSLNILKDLFTKAELLKFDYASFWIHKHDYCILINDPECKKKTNGKLEQYIQNDTIRSKTIKEKIIKRLNEIG